MNLKLPLILLIPMLGLYSQAIAVSQELKQTTWIPPELPFHQVFEASTGAIIQSVSELESNRDPKCHATATRLESLIYGTPLSDAARYEKTELQKQFVKLIWQQAALVSGGSKTALNTDQIVAAATKFMPVNAKGNETLFVELDKMTVPIALRDLNHYGSIAYSLRAIMAVQQDNLLSIENEFPMLSKNAVEKLKYYTDIFTLSLLQVADQSARAADQYEISRNNIQTTWQTFYPSLLNKETKSTQQYSNGNSITGTLAAIIEQKLASYKKYNTINEKVFARNLQVYFALASLPTDKKQAEAFQLAFRQAMLSFSTSLYIYAESFAKNDLFISEHMVQLALDKYLPHIVNSYEDVIYFPKYPDEDQAIIEAYDLDAFRDSGLHWLYLANTMDELGSNLKKEADPFAAELFTEGIAHYALLLLREAGAEAKARLNSNEAILDARDIYSAHKAINNKVNAYASFRAKPQKVEQIISADISHSHNGESKKYFSLVTKDVGIQFEHRSADWLSRQMRSYLKVGQVGNLTIPPAFGGAGAAAEDINNDGFTDLLLLSGKGNKLWVNQDGKFIDVTDSSGLNWVRDDGLPGEPRQPLIADINNDGLQDIVITYVNDSHRVYKNNGDNTFSDVTHVANLGGRGLVGGPATLVDVNNDGLLDLYLAYFGNYLQGNLPTLARRNSNGIKNELFINKGHFRFEKSENAMGADNSGWGQAVTHTDLNMDGWQDLIVGNDFGINAYYINQKGESFVNYAKQLKTDKPSYTMNISLTDLNRDGIADVYISNITTMNKDESYVLPSKDTPAKFNPNKMANMRVVENNDLFLSSLSSGVLEYQMSDKVGRGDTSTGWAWGAEFFDADNDGDDDLYVTNGMNDYFVYSTINSYSGENVIFPDARKASNVFFLNAGGRLNNQSASSGLDVVANSRSLTYLDIENDGDLDIVINNYHDTTMVFENSAETLKNNWLKIRLKGAPDKGVNIDAIGAQVLVGFGEKGYAWRQVSGSQGYMSVHPKQQNIGLGKATQARIMVIWPNGKRESFGVLAANKSYTLRYGL